MEVERSLFVIIVVSSFTWGREVRGSRTADARSALALKQYQIPLLRVQLAPALIAFPGDRPSSGPVTVHVYCTVL